MRQSREISHGVKKIILTLITLYQKTFSPDHGPFRHFFFAAGCRFYPSCSQYGYEAIDRYGVIRGLLKSMVRIAKCNPFHRGGIDPLP